MRVALVLYALFFSGQIISLYRFKNRLAFVVFKIATSAVFFAFALTGLIPDLPALRTIFFIAAFFLCLTGDALLGFTVNAKPVSFFLCGLASFFFAHLFFSAGLFLVLPPRLPDLLIPLCAVAVCFILTGLKDMQTGSLRPLVLVYAAVVSLFFARCLTQSLVGHSLKELSVRHALMLCGSAFFFISDCIILFLCFYRKRFALTEFFNLSTYYAGMFLLALAMCVR